MDQGATRLGVVCIRAPPHDVGSPEWMHQHACIALRQHCPKTRTVGYVCQSRAAKDQTSGFDRHGLFLVVQAQHNRKPPEHVAFGSKMRLGRIAQV
jgi:hypothetical protein